ncbi:MAG: hypothetical protein COU40_01845 [Candidatus Moranbacteria bacterium CG10_big_fil_rev_8_21_14_0_10_35_21]|nr:MAG: hypothetical protein COU40_01845 [Candidatus Moranbacteria bacterium CG10_big_fil_rev_8_21_14_0_10_35_21]PJA88241.1 MAG: hypothetical protein CO139_04120 [Candidatus Moranbacteria bacterium CG_4_9_14_3_um_filter_36_9]PJC54923.1 MAG: hypothetical protein CO027_04745 [Candidatus Komeilibacteria bacterium CG_4_9_14_0_2_um_filter_36_13]
MKIAITGAAGYLGSNLKKYFTDKAEDVYSLDKNIINDTNFIQTDLINYEEVLSALRKVSPDVIIHTAALSSLAQCEKDQKLASKINIQGTKNIIEAIKQVNPNIKLIFISSDYVFAGDRGNYREEDERNSKTFYGQTKKVAEDEIKTNLTNYIICRTAAIYGRGGNFFNFLVDSFNQNKEIEVYDNVFFTPTYIDYLIDSLAKLLEKDFNGIVHIAGKDVVSRYQFALKIATALGKGEGLIKQNQQPAGGLIAQDSSLNSDCVKKILNNFCPSLEKTLNYCFNDFVYSYFSFIDDRGKLIGLSQNYKWEEINYIESAKEATRGGHYHKMTKEGFYIIDGKVKIKLHNLANNYQRVFSVESGDFFIVEPEMVHTFEVLEDARWINMLSQAIKGKDKDIYKI